MQGAIVYAETVIIVTTATSQSQVLARLYSPASYACVIPCPPAQNRLCFYIMEHCQHCKVTC